MTSRERVQTALAHKEPDRLPFDLGGTFLSSAEPEMQRRIAEVLGLTGERDPRFRNFDDRIQRHFGCDLRSITPRKYPDWGIDWSFHSFKLHDATIEDLESYPWPEPSDDLFEGLEEEARFLHEETDYFIVAGQIGQGIFELGCYLRGYDQILIDMVEEPDFVKRFNDHALETNKRLHREYFGRIGRYVDMVLIGDDLATQENLYMSPKAFRDLIKPWFREYIADIKRWCPQAKIAHHCCGSSIKLFEDLKEIGVDVINPVQTRAAGMAPENLAVKKRELGLSFHGGVDLQYILPFGTVQETEEFVKDLIAKLGPGGGYILAACHSLPHDVKPENVVAMLEAAKKYGKYPLSL